MRLPTSKIHRAFRAFDGLDDDACWRLLNIGLSRRSGLVRALPAALGTVLGLALVAGWIAARVSGHVGDYFASPLVEGLVVLVPLLLAGALAGLLARDLFYFRVLWVESHRDRCPYCGYSLAGLAVQYLGDHPEPGNQFVRCSECGRKVKLLDHGLTPADLVPLEERGLPEGVGRMRGVRR